MKTKPTTFLFTLLTVFAFIFACETEGNNNSGGTTPDNSQINFFEVNGDTTYIDTVYEILFSPKACEITIFEDSIVEEQCIILRYSTSFVLANKNITYTPYYTIKKEGTGDMLFVNFSSPFDESIPAGIYTYGDTTNSFHYSGSVLIRKSLLTNDTSAILRNFNNGTININKTEDKYLMDFQFQTDSGYTITGNFCGMTKFYNNRK